MIDLYFTPFEIQFSLIGIRIDIIQLMYDVSITGLLVWCITKFIERDRDIRSEFNREVQRYERELAILKLLIDRYEDSPSNLLIESVLILESPRNSFEYLPSTYDSLITSISET